MDNKTKQDLKQQLTAMNANQENFKSEKPQQEETSKTQHLFKIMGSLFGAKWERQNGIIGGSAFYEWADIIEPMLPETIRSKFTELEKRFKRDVLDGKDIWPPTIAYFLALGGQKRVNEAMYQEFTYELPKHTKDEYKEFAKSGMEKIKEGLNHG